MGDMIKVEVLAKMGKDCSFVNSLRASARGCGIPLREILFGPFRDWIYPRVLRSKRVKKAIARRAVRKMIIDEIEEESINPKKYLSSLFDFQDQ